MSIVTLSRRRSESAPEGRDQHTANDQDESNCPTALTSELSLKVALRYVRNGFLYLGADDPDHLPIGLKSIIDNQHWDKTMDRNRHAFKSFGAFAAAPEPHGLDARRLERAMYLRKFLFDRHLLEVWIDVLEHLIRRPGRPEKLAEGEHSGPFYRLPTGSNGVDRILLRLKRERTDLLDRVLQREMTIQDAAVAAGWKKKKTASRSGQTLIQSDGIIQLGLVGHLPEKQITAFIRALFLVLSPDAKSELLTSLQ